MSRRRNKKYSAELKLQAVQDYLNGGGSQREICKKYGISAKRTLEVWIMWYNKTQSVYYTLFKCPRAYVRPRLTPHVSDHYTIALRLWYNGHKELKERRGAGTEIYMTKGRKTTLEERIEIVAYCIENGKDYPKTIEKYGVSYQQIYSWIRKYEEKGVDGLCDGRGRTKPFDEMNEVERLKAENRLLRAQIEEKEMENLLLKKLNELEGWDY